MLRTALATRGGRSRGRTLTSFEGALGDLQAVADALGLDRFALFGMSEGGAVATAYAARHPERVSHLVLLGAFARGTLRRDITVLQREEAQLLVKLVRIGWDRDNPAYRQVFTTMLMPEGTLEQQQWFNDFQRLSASPEHAAAILETSYELDVTSLAGTVKVPTLVFHARGDGHVPFEEGRILAALIPSARFLPLDSRNHVLLESEPAWTQFLAEVRTFLAEGAEPESRRSLGSLMQLTRAELRVLTLLARGLHNAAIAARLGKREKTVRNQVSSILGKLQVHSRAEAVALARDTGIGAPSATD